MQVKRMKTFLKFAIVAALIPAAFAQNPRQAARRQIFQALNLSRDQRVQAQAILQNAAQSARPLAQQMKQNRDALNSAVNANDAKRIQDLSAEQGKLRGQVLGVRSEAMAKFYAILTPDQRAAADQAKLKFRDLIKKRLAG